MRGVFALACAFAAIFLVQLTSGCRTGGTPPGAEVQSAVDKSAVQPAAQVPPLQPVVPEAPSVPRDSQPVTLISGFNLRGADECVALKLAPEVACVPRTQALQAACAKNKGEILRCDDCRLMCSKPVAAKARSR